MTVDMPAVPPGSVIVTPYQMYEEMRAVRDEVKHLAAIVDPALNEVRSDISDNRSKIDALESRTAAKADALENRLRAVEGRLWFAAGLASAAGGAGGYIASALTGG